MLDIVNDPTTNSGLATDILVSIGNIADRYAPLSYFNFSGKLDIFYRISNLNVNVIFYRL